MDDYILIDGIIEDIEYIEMEEKEYNETMVYDIGVEDNHNFICENTLVHNCHNIPSNIIFNVSCMAKNAYYRIGVSATPWRDSDDDILIEAAINIRKPSLSINASKLISKGKLTPCVINFVKIKNDNIEWQGSYNKTYNEAISNNFKRNLKIIDLTIKELNNNKTILILVNKIEHGNLLKALLENKLKNNKVNVNHNGKSYDVSNIEFVSGVDDCDKREAIFKSVKSGFTRILIGSTIADEGLDLPCLDTLILAGSGKVSTRAFQRIGRVLRLYPGKTKAIIYDMMDLQSTFYKHYLVRKALYETEPLWEINYIN